MYLAVTNSNLFLLKSFETVRGELLLHNNLLVQPWPSSCWPAHRMGIYSNPLNNGLIQHTFKINFSFVDFGPSRQACQAKKPVAIENSLRLQTRGIPAAAAEAM